MMMHNREPDDSSGGIRIQQFIQKRRRGFFNPTIVLGILLALLLTYLIAIPVLMLITESVQVHSIDAGYFQEEVGSFTLRYFERALVSKVARVLFLDPLVNTLVIAVFITFFRYNSWLCACLDHHPY